MTSRAIEDQRNISAALAFSTFLVSNLRRLQLCISIFQVGGNMKRGYPRPMLSSLWLANDRDWVRKQIGTLRRRRAKVRSTHSSPKQPPDLTHTGNKSRGVEKELLGTRKSARLDSLRRSRKEEDKMPGNEHSFIIAEEVVQVDLVSFLAPI